MQHYCNVVRCQRGVTLIEAIIFLSILAVVLGVVLSKAGIALSSNRASQSIDAAHVIAASIRSAYQMRTDYTGLNTRAVINGGMVPEFMVSGNKISHAWGGDVVIRDKDESGVNGFEIDFQNVPATDCSRFVNGISVGFQKISVGSTVAKQLTDTGASDPAVVGTACGSTGHKKVTLFSY